MLRRIVTAGVLVVGVAACGGSSSSPKTTTSTTTPAATGASTPPATSTPTTPQITAGGGTTPPPAPAGGPALTKSAYIAKADIICSQAQVEFSAQQKQIDTAGRADQAHDTPANRAAVADALRADLTLAQQQLARLRALTPPVADRPTVTAYLAAVATQLGLVGHLASGIQANDATGVKALNAELTNGASQTRILASSYGFKVCGSGTG